MVRVSGGVLSGGIAAATGCLAVPSGGDLPGLATYEPVWISASWGGKANTPLDRTDREPAEFGGPRCPAESVVLEYFPDFCPGWNFAGLKLRNNCTQANDVAICARKGSAGPT